MNENGRGEDMNVDLFGEKLSLNVTGSEERRVRKETSTRWKPVFEPCFLLLYLHSHPLSLSISDYTKNKLCLNLKYSKVFEKIE